MKSLLRIIRRYSLTVGVIIFIIVFSNMCIFIGVAYMTMYNVDERVYGRDSMEQIGRELSEEEEGIVLSKNGQKILENTDFVWAMALDSNGNIVWRWELPKDMPEKYTLQDVAAFSRWYLKDYPVRTWRSKELLLVFGCGKDEIVRHDLLTSMEVFEFLPVCIRMGILLNFMIVMLLIIGFGFRFYRSMKPLVEGVERLALGEKTDIRETGSMKELAVKLNLVSRRLEQQKKQLLRRDEARTEWIAGVSHDIRTPLSLIVGYSEKLAEDDSLSEDNRKIARHMKRQSLIIRQLISDLNLTSKLVYQSQPLKKRICSPASLLRDCIADFYNGEPESLPYAENGMADFFLETVMGQEADSVRIMADESLIKRALRNLIGNCIRHNKEGCRIFVHLWAEEDSVHWRIEDTGKGIPEVVVQNMDRQDSAVHIMGLRLAAQIAGAHGGGLVFVEREGGNYDVEFSVTREA